MKKLDLKYEPRLRRRIFLNRIDQLEMALSSNKYTRDVLQDYPTSTKIKRPKDSLAIFFSSLISMLFLIKKPEQAQPSTRTKVQIYSDVYI